MKKLTEAQLAGLDILGAHMYVQNLGRLDIEDSLKDIVMEDDEDAVAQKATEEQLHVLEFLGEWEEYITEGSDDDVWLDFADENYRIAFERAEQGHHLPDFEDYGEFESRALKYRIQEAVQDVMHIIVRDDYGDNIRGMVKAGTTGRFNDFSEYLEHMQSCLDVDAIIDEQAEFFAAELEDSERRRRLFRWEIED